MGVYQRQLKDGLKWRYKGYKDGAYYCSPAIYRTEEEAAEAERRYLGKRKGDTVEALVESRLDFMKIHTTNRDYFVETKTKCQEFMDYLGATFPVRDVTKQHAQEFLQKVALEAHRNAFTPHQPNHYIRILRALFNHAIDVKDVDMKNPFKKMKLLPVGDKRKYIPSDGEVVTVREKLRGMELELYNFVAETGCRINEAIRLRTEDVRKDLITLYTRKAKNSNLTPRVIPRPTWLRVSNDHERVFHLWNKNPRFLEEVIGYYSGRLKRPVRDAKGDLIYKNGKPLWTKIRTPELPEGVRWNWHNLRHRRASIWAAEGKPIFEIMTRLGHNNVSTTMIYLQSLGFTSS